jgi:large repetitive protein
MFSSMRICSALLALSTLSLGGCTSLLGDFTFDPNPNSGNGGSGNMEQGDIVVMPTMLTTSEQGAKANFTIMLRRKPSADVTVALSSSNKGEGTVSPSLLTFTPDNFGAPQMAQVAGVDDNLEDMAQTYFVITSPATSADQTYQNIDPINPQVTNVDDDTAGFMLVPMAGLVTTESGGQAMFTIALNKAPTADVSIDLSSDNIMEGTVSPASLMFTAADWMAPQMVTVTGVDDALRDGPQKYHVVTAAATSTDPKYSGQPVPDEEVTNTDNDTANIVLMPATGLLTSEKGEMTSLTIALGSPPTGDVVIGLTSSDMSEGTVMPASVTFTPLNWMAPQVISVTGVDDDRIDGSQPYQVVTSIISSADPGYATLEPPNADVTNIDDDTPGLRLTPTEGLKTSELLDSATFTVVLNSKPSADVFLDVVSSRPTEGVATPAKLHFTEMNWDAPQSVSVMGQNDNVADKDQQYVVHVTPSADTLDADYAKLLEQDVSVTNTDDDSAGVDVKPTKGLTTTESGGTATFTVNLRSQPTGDVTIALSSSNTAEGTVSPAALTFTADNYRSPQMVTVRGVDDKVQDGGQPYRINTDNAKSADTNYQGMEVPNVDVTNTDNDTAGITINPKNTVTLTTAEKGDTATFTVVLNSQPTADVSFSVTSTDTTEGTLSPASLKFTSVNWNAPQTVTVKGVDDKMHDGPQLYRATFGAITSNDPLYAMLPKPLDVNLANTDDDSPGITLINAANLTTNEKGPGTATFQVVLDSAPSGNVDIGVSSSRTGEGTVSPAKLTFTNVNWASPQNVTITGVDEKIQDGNQSYFVIFAAATSTDKDYQGLVPKTASVPVTNLDDDSAGIVVTPPPAGYITKEDGGTAVFAIQLRSQPTADVTIPLKSNKTSEGTVSPASLTFTAANWSGARMVTLTGVDDKIQDGDQPFVISIGPATSTDTKYVGMTSPDLTASNHDDDTAKILVDTTSTVDTTEKGGTSTFTIRLQTQPTADVTIGLTSKDVKEGTVIPASVTFNAMNWASPQLVTITGVDDKTQDGDKPYLIDVGAATSTDGLYKGMDPPDVSLKNKDDDQAAIRVTQISATTTEGGGTATFSVVLDTQPTAPVTVSFKSNNLSEGTLSDASWMFSTTNWNSPKTITVTGVEDDSTADGDQQFSVVFGAPTSADPLYSNVAKTPASLLFTNTDNDSPGIDVSPTTGKTSEDGASKAFTFKITLKSKPKASVTIPISSSDEGEGVVAPSSVTFSTTDWQSEKSVVVTGVNDDEFDGSPVYKILVGKPTSTDTAYAEIDPADVTLTNVDNDTAGFNVSAPTNGGTTSEAGGTSTFTITLTSKPTADVTITLTSSDNTEGSVTPSKVVLTPTNWNDATAHIVTVHGENDDIQDDLQPYTIVTSLSSSADTNYDQKDVNDVAVNNTDNDTAGYTLTGTTDLHTSEAGDSVTFMVYLNSQPTGPVSIPVSSNNTDEGVLDPGKTTVDFTVAEWKKPQSVVVHGVNDAVPTADGNISYKIQFGKATSTDANYAKLQPPPDVTVVNDDDDNASLSIVAPMTMTSETGLPTVEITVVLTTKPKSTVTIPVVSSNEAEGRITSPGSAMLTFDATNWNSAQSIIVTGQDDLILDPGTMYSIQIGPPQSTDTKYSSLLARKVNLVNADDEVAPP